MRQEVTAEFVQNDQTLALLRGLSVDYTGLPQR